MQIRACILLLIWSLLLIEPLSANFNIKSPYTACAEKQKPRTKKPGMQSCCAKTSCEQADDSEDENGCEGNRCNPLMSCPTGNFYMFSSTGIFISALIVSKQKAELIDDNRISKFLAECWHPPEII